MKLLNVALVSAVLLVNSTVTSALANEKEVVQTFYDFLSNPASKEHAAAFKSVTAEDWQSIGDYTGVNKKRDQFIGQVSGFFATLMPDLNWEVQEMIQEGNKVVVRSRATGTPKGPLFGVDGKGKSFDVLTIDIHTIENGKIVTSYHIEDWAGALQQLKGQ
ncbi:polyketide cyclase [Chromatiales bacterium (ex Bugula neritina AB1)]|nr:polyketide cyclase [Chromatiales bacterium (ex Bugula neritina AB1)]